MWILEYIFFSYFALSVLYVLIFSTSAVFNKPHVGKERRGTNNRIAILVPAYKEDNVIVNTAQALVQLNYPAELFDVIIIGDTLKPSTIEKLNELPVIFLGAQHAKSTKANSLNFAFQMLDEEQYDIAIISDADNIMQKDFLSIINCTYGEKCQAMQGRRVAKNLNTPFAVLDALNEIINNHIFRKGFNALGLSSALIGSGMAFNYKKLKTFLAEINAVGGFDKELQLLFIENHIKIHYLENAIVFDEKIDAPSSFAHQRRRWLSSQYIYFKKYLKKGVSQFLRGNISYFNIAVLYNLFPTRSLTIISIFVLASVATIAHSVISISYIYWWLLLGIYIAALLFAIPKQFYNKEFLRAILKLPYALLIMVKSLFRLKGADKQFIHTKHTRTEIDKSIFYSK